MTAVLYRHSAWFFGAFSIAVACAFWPSYFSSPFSQPDFRFHVHGLSLTLWCLMLVSQASLIRLGRRRVHAVIGKLSYLLVPTIVMAAVTLKHSRMQGFQLTPGVLYSLASVLFALIAFVVIYALAIFYRNQPAIHARYMICSVFPLFSPLTDRLIVVQFPQVLSLVQRITGSGSVPFINLVGFILADLMAVALSIWDWRSNRRFDVFPLALAVLVIFQCAVLAVYRLPAWQSFGQWFLHLPLS